MHAAIEAILTEQGVVTTTAHRGLKSSLARLARAGLLENPLPGVFTPPSDGSVLQRLRAVTAWAGPAGVLHSRTAAGLWLPELAGSVAFLAHPTLRSRRGVVVCRRTIPPEFVVVGAGIRAASPAYAAAELASQDDGRAACEALRLRLVTPDDLAMATASLAGSRGQRERLRVITSCADNPWSYAELRFHRILRTAGIRGWVANRPVRVGGSIYQPDARLPAERVVIEVDGRATHEPAAQFRRDRERQNAFTAAGYLVIRFTWEQLDDPEYVIRTVRAVVRLRRE